MKSIVLPSFSNLIKIEFIRNSLGFLLSVLGGFYLYLNISNININFFDQYCILMLVISVIFLPKRLMSPINILIGYYVLWYVIAPYFGPGYTYEQLNSFYYKLALIYIYSTFVFILFSMKLGLYWGGKIRIKSYTSSKKNSLSKLKLTYFFLITCSTVLVILIVLFSGGFSVWLQNPGDAFLNRSGSGVFVILSHFTSMALAVVAGYISFHSKKSGYLFVYILWLTLTMPVHGSKFQIILLLLLAFLPYLIRFKTLSLHTTIMVLTMLMIFIVGMFFRGFEGGNFEMYLSLFGYFSTLHNFALLLEDFAPGDYFTFFYPFNKFLILLGLATTDYFDLNHLLTDIYYPEAWSIRATEQWPVEADMYLNFNYFFGLPLLFIYFGLIGVFYSYAVKSKSLGVWFVSILLSFYMISHLRGTLYNFNDFYLVPYMVLVWLLFKKYSLDVGCQNLTVSRVLSDRV